jgi:hypothetical protein
MTIPDGTNLPPVQIAFVIEGEIADILHTDERLAAIFTSEPLMLDITDRASRDGIAVGHLYNYETGEFTAPEQKENRE